MYTVLAECPSDAYPIPMVAECLGWKRGKKGGRGGGGGKRKVNHLSIRSHALQWKREGLAKDMNSVFFEAVTVF